MDDLLLLEKKQFFVLLTRSCKLLLVVNEGALSGATGGKVQSNGGRLWW